MRLNVEALNALDPNMTRENWVRMCFAFKDSGGSEDEFIEWSQRGDKFNLADTRTTWRNAKPMPGGVTEATLFMEARKAGWKPAPGGNGGDGPPAIARPRPAPVAESPPAAVTDPTPIWDASIATAGHPYLARKQIGAHGARTTTAGTLVIPYINESGALQTVQFITGDGDKRFLKGARQKGAVAVVGEPKGAALVIVAEGFATAASLNEATGFPAIASGSRGTMPEAARIARVWAPGARVVIAADRGDMATPIAAARAVAGFVAVPGDEADADGFDFNDWRLSGTSDEAIRARIEHATPPAVEAVERPLVSVVRPFESEDVRAPLAPTPVEAARVSVEDVAPRAQFITDSKGRPFANLANVATWLESGALGEFAMDTFTGVALWKGLPIGENELGEITRATQGGFIAGRFVFAKVAVPTVADAIAQATRAGAFNSNVRWLEDLAPWDGTPRIANFFQDIAGTPGTEYYLGVGKYFWLSLVNRMMYPGCKADAAIVLIGPQGVGKSSLGRIVGGERYGEASLTRIGERDWFAELRGKIIVEISELAGHNRAELETIKAVLSRQVDEYRPAYARTAQSIPRGCVFYGTTNERDFLIDSSGNRRWLPVESNGPLALDTAQGMRDQCYAEAFAIVRAGNAGAYWLIPDATEQQAEHVARDPWIDLLDEKLRGIAGQLPAEIMNVAVYELLKIPAERQTGGGTGRRITAAMRALGYERMRRVIEGQPQAKRGFERK